nr:MAG TPA: hypothetical protein [Caudoviricetes sp.]
MSQVDNIKKKGESKDSPFSYAPSRSNTNHTP